MAQITISNIDLLSNVDNNQLEKITGGGLGALGGAVAGGGGSILNDVVNRRNIDWRSASTYGGAGAVGGAITGSLGGWVGASLGGDD